MALDARILMGLQPVQREPYANVLAKAMQIKAAQQGMDLQAMQIEEYRRKAAEAQQAQARYQQYVQSIPSPQANALATLGGNAAPTVANAQRMPQVDPRQNELYRALQAGVIQPGDYLKEAYPTAPEPKDMVVGDTLVRVGRQGATPLFKNERDPKLPEGMRIGANGQPEWIPGYLEGRGQVAAKGATNVAVNTGQKGFDNTLKLRGDFRSEPVYKAHQEMTSAYSQIQQSLKQGTPAGDLAGATKIMKLLDPGSVVRESELGMAMQASGLMDRVTNYANLIITGQKLTPQQRKDFQSLADALYSESVKQYNGKRAEYQGIADRNGLPVLDVLGPESAAPNMDGWGIKPKGQ